MLVQDPRPYLFSEQNMYNRVVLVCTVNIYIHVVLIRYGGRERVREREREGEREGGREREREGGREREGEGEGESLVVLHSGGGE